MSRRGMDCHDCHGSMETVSENPNPWLVEPRCDNAACHGSDYQQDQALYGLSKEQGGILRGVLRQHSRHRTQLGGQ
jgi:hypothetical protein